MKTQNKSLQEPAEFCDFRGLEQKFGIRRGLAYLLIKEGAIQSVNLRHRGRVKGKRLIEVASVREYLRSRREGAGAGTGEGGAL